MSPNGRALQVAVARASAAILRKRSSRALKGKEDRAAFLWEGREDVRGPIKGVT